jgi:hypothetical protein
MNGENVQQTLSYGKGKPVKPPGAWPRMLFFPSSSLFQKNNARNIIYMAVLIFLKCLDLRKNVYSRTTS